MKFLHYFKQVLAYTTTIILLHSCQQQEPAFINFSKLETNNNILIIKNHLASINANPLLSIETDFNLEMNNITLEESKLLLEKTSNLIEHTTKLDLPEVLPNANQTLDSRTHSSTSIILSKHSKTYYQSNTPELKISIYDKNISTFLSKLNILLALKRQHKIPINYGTLLPSGKLDFIEQFVQTSYQENLNIYGLYFTNQENTAQNLNGFQIHINLHPAAPSLDLETFLELHNLLYSLNILEAASSNLIAFSISLHTINMKTSAVKVLRLLNLINNELDEWLNNPALIQLVTFLNNMTIHFHEKDSNYVSSSRKKLLYLDIRENSEITENNLLEVLLSYARNN